MQYHNRHSQGSRRGVVYILALILLAVFSTLAVALATTNDLNLQKSRNLDNRQEAQLAAESGLAFMTFQMQHCGVSGSLRGQALLNQLGLRMCEMIPASPQAGRSYLNGTPTLGGQSVGNDSTTITVPRIELGGGKSFTARITLPDRDTLRLAVTGEAGGVTRNVSIDFHPSWEEALGYGVCSKGPVELGHNTELQGLYLAYDGSLYSAASGVAIGCISGVISGDISLSTPGASVALGGTIVGGTISYDVPPVTMPTIDLTPYKSLATNIRGSGTNFTSGTFTNVRIPAGTNPTFGNNVVIKGVLYIQAPNVVTFENNPIFTGVMVADDPPAGTLPENAKITFNNDLTINPVQALTDDVPGATALKKLKGAAILCPGFAVEVKNNMTSVGGIIAVKELIAKNNLNSTVYGSLLIYGDAGLDFRNNTDLVISLFGSSPPPGFVGSGMLPLTPDAATYTEIVGG